MPLEKFREFQDNSRKCVQQNIDKLLWWWLSPAAKDKCVCKSVEKDLRWSLLTKMVPKIYLERCGCKSVEKDVSVNRLKKKCLKICCETYVIKLSTLRGKKYGHMRRLMLIPVRHMRRVYAHSCWEYASADAPSWQAYASADAHSCRQ